MIKSNFMKKLTVMLLVLLVTLSLGAAKIHVTWNWHATNEGINYFRYQLNGELDNKWVEVPVEQTSVVYKELDNTRDNTLYLQQSRDGKVWSPIATKTVPAAVKVAEQTKEEAKPVVKEETKETPEEKPVVKETKKEVKTETKTVEVKTEPKTEVKEVEVKEEAKPVVKEEVKEAPAKKAVVTEINNLGTTTHIYAKVEAKEETKPAVKKEATTEVTNTVVVKETKVEKTTVVEKESTTKEAVEKEVEYLNDPYTMISIFGGAYVAQFDAPDTFIRALGDKNTYKFEKQPNIFAFAGLDVTWNNVAQWGRMSGLGIKIGGAYQAIPRNYNDYIETWNHAKDSSFGETLNNFFGSMYNCTDLYFALAYDLRVTQWLGFEFLGGTFATFSWPAKHHVNGEKMLGLSHMWNMNISFGALAGIKFNFYLSDVVSLGVTPLYRYEWGNPKGNQLTAQASIGFRF